MFFLALYAIKASRHSYRLVSLEIKDRSEKIHMHIFIHIRKYSQLQKLNVEINFSSNSLSKYGKYPMKKTQHKPLI